MSGLNTNPPDSAAGQGKGVSRTPTPKDFRKFGEPNVRDLCEYVGAEIPARWEPFGRFVGVREGTLKAIQANHAGQPNWQKKCFSQVFVKWHDGLTLDYTWEKVAEALVSRDVDSKWLATRRTFTCNKCSLQIEQALHSGSCPWNFPK